MEEELIWIGVEVKEEVDGDVWKVVDLVNDWFVVIVVVSDFCEVVVGVVEDDLVGVEVV